MPPRAGSRTWRRDSSDNRKRDDRWLQKLEAANQFLAQLPAHEIEPLRPHWEPVFYGVKDVISRPNGPLRYAVFPLDAVLSLISSMEDGKNVAVHLVGSEGLLGIRALLGATSSVYTTIVRIPGSCLRIRLEAIQPAFRRGGLLQQAALNYASRVIEELSQTAACNRVHLLEQRLARWLLMLQSRCRKDDFSITHESLAQMLGSPRSEVTISAGILRKAGLIDYGRGGMKIMDRKGLEAVSCKCSRTEKAASSGRYKAFSVGTPLQPQEISRVH